MAVFRKTIYPQNHFCGVSSFGATGASVIVLKEPESLLAAPLAAIEVRARVDSWRLAARDEARDYAFARYRDNIAAMLDEQMSGNYPK